jgi:hypothetical protein
MFIDHTAGVRQAVDDQYPASIPGKIDSVVLIHQHREIAGSGAKAFDACVEILGRQNQARRDHVRPKAGAISGRNDYYRVPASPNFLDERFDVLVFDAGVDPLRHQDHAVAQVRRGFRSDWLGERPWVGSKIGDQDGIIRERRSHVDPSLRIGEARHNVNRQAGRRNLDMPRGEVASAQLKILFQERPYKLQLSIIL